MKLDFNKFDEAYNTDVEKIKENKSKKTNKNGNRIAILGYSVIVILAFFVLANIINGYVEINEMKYGNVKLSNKIEVLEKEIEDLRIELDNKTSYAVIDKYAREELGMISVNKSQKLSIQFQQHYSLNKNRKNAILYSDNKKAIND